MIKRLVITNIVLGLAVLALLGSTIFPTLHHIRGFNQRIAEERANLEFRYANRQVLRKVLSDLVRLKEELPQLREIALPEGQELSLVTAVERLAKEYGVTVTLRLNQPPDSKRTDYSRLLGIDLEATGPFRQVAAFLERIEHLPQSFQKPRLTLSELKLENGLSAVHLTYSAEVSWPRLANTSL